MRNALFLAGIWVGIIVVAYGVVYWGGGPTEIPYLPDVPFTETVYTDPGGHFDITLPAGWIASTGETFAPLAGPEREIQGGVAVVTADDPGEAIASAWTVIAPNASPQPETVTSGTALDPTAPAWHVSYLLSDDQSAVAAAYPTSGTVIVLILQGPSESMARRSLDIERIEVRPFAIMDGPDDMPSEAGEGAGDLLPMEEPEIIEPVDEAVSETVEDTGSDEPEVLLPEDVVDTLPAEVQTPSDVMDEPVLP